MGSIPLPALDVRPPQQQADPLEQYGRLMQLQNMQRMQPLQQQQAQQQVQSGQLDIQQKQQALTDQKAMTSAMQQWDGQDYNKLIPLVIKNGGSAQAVMGLKSKVLEQQQAISTTLKNNADAGLAQVNAQKTKNDEIAGALTPLIDPKQVPDAQLPAAVMSTAQDLVQKGLLDPQHAQTAQQIAQSGDPTQIRSQLDMLRKGFMAQSQIIDDAKNTAQTQEAQANTAAKSGETAYYQQHGGAPGVPAEMMQQSDFIAKHPGSGPSDYVAWKAKQSPMALVMGNQLGGGQGGSQGNPALDLVANNYLQTGQMPPELSRSPGTITAVINRAAQINAEKGGGSIAANSAEYKANTDSLKKLQTNFDQVQAFENTATANMNLLQQTAQKIPDLGSRFANVPVRMVNSQMIGTANMAAFKTALATAQTEAAKVLNSSNATGVLSDSSRHELQDIIDGNVPLPAMVASLNTLKQDMANRTQSYKAQIGDIQGRIKGAAPAQPGGTVTRYKIVNGQLVPE